MRALPLVACLLAWTLGAPTLVAQSPPATAQGTRAIEKGREGVALYEEGKWLEALARFNEAEALYHSPVFLLYAARSLHHSGRLLEARAVLRRVVDEKLDEAAPDAWQEAQGDARAELSALEAELPSVIVVVEGGSANTTLTLDGKPVSPGVPIELDPGAHKVVASDGSRRSTVDFTSARGAQKLTVAARFAAPAPASKPPKPQARPREPAPASGPYLPGIILAGSGGLVLLAGGVVGTLALLDADSARDNLPASCRDTTCPISARSEVESSLSPSRDLATAADVLLFSGAAIAVVGVVLLLVEPGAANQEQRVSLHADSLQLKF